MTDAEKTAAVLAKEAARQMLMEKREIFKSQFDIVSSGGDKKEALKIIIENMDKLVALDKEAQAEPSSQKEDVAPGRPTTPAYPVP